MATTDKAIGDLIAAEEVTGADLLVLEQNSVPKKLTGAVLLKFLLTMIDGHGGIKSITKTGTSGLVDTYTITMTDGSTSTFTVTNGEKGDQGDASRVWFKYANVKPTENYHSIFDVPGPWMGVCVNYDSKAPDDWQAYTWAQIQGDPGKPGPVGPAPDFSIGSVTSLEYGTQPWVQIHGTDANPILSFGIPRGKPGKDGSGAPDLAVNDPEFPGYVAGRTHYRIADAEFIFESSVALDDSGTNENAPGVYGFLSSGDVAVVTWSGKIYSCRVRDVSDALGIYEQAAFGNLHLIDASFDNTGEPFAFRFDMESTLICSPDHASQTVSFSLSKAEKVQKLDNVFLDLDWVPAKEETGEDGLILKSRTISFQESVSAAVNSMAATGGGFGIVAGGLYTVTWDGVDYECRCVEGDDGGLYLGDPALAGQTGGSGEPFCIQGFRTGQYKTVTKLTVYRQTEETQTVTLEILGHKETTWDKIPEEFLPDGYGGGGGTGEDGGYYVPSVAQAEAGVMEVSFTPSKADMPAVPAVSVALPEGEAGYSPVVEVLQGTTISAGGMGRNYAEISVTDKDGNVQTAEVFDGVTPHIGDNGNWFIDEEDTGVKAQGEDGYTPQKGIDYSDGTNGKTAYQYAQEGGYTGTEEDFAAKLAEEPLIGSTSDITPEQVSAALRAGRDVVLSYTDETYGIIYFSGFLEVPALEVVASSGVQQYGGMMTNFALIGDTSNGKWIFEYGQLAKYSDIPQIPAALPNPKALTFTGAVTGAYDGSTAMSVNIPTKTENAVLYDAQSLTEAQRIQARKNLGVVGTVTPQGYGAKGDNSTDDTAAFQNALTNNRVVYVPSGKYKISGELVIGYNCQLELAQDAVLYFTQTTGNCITIQPCGFLKGNHATVSVPYEFSGHVINIDTGTVDVLKGWEPFKQWDPMWKVARYITDLNIVKPDSRGFYYSLDGTCNGTAVYVCADGDDTSTFIWATSLTGLRIAGAFSYGVYAETLNAQGESGWNHEMKVEGFIDGSEVGVYLKNCKNAYLSTVVQPRRAYTTAGEYIPYAKWGIVLENAPNSDLSGSRIWDWDSEKSLWSEGSINQHLVLLGNCEGAILNEWYYYANPNYDIRELIYTDTPSNYDKITILQEPFTRWFKPIDSVPYFFDGNYDRKLLLQEEFDECFQTDRIQLFTDKLATATNADGSIFNDVGYAKYGFRWNLSDGSLITDTPYYGCTGFIPVTMGSTIRAQNFNVIGDGYCGMALFDSAFNRIASCDGNALENNTASYWATYTKTDEGFEIAVAGKSTIAYATFSYKRSDMLNNPVVAVDEEIGFRQEGFMADGIKVKVENIEGLSEILGSYITDVDTLLGGDS